MGTRLCALSREHQGLELIASLTGERSARAGIDQAPAPGAPKLRSAAAFASDLSGAIDSATRTRFSRWLVIDFSAPSALSTSITIAQSLNAALLVGTTGLDRQNVENFQRHADRLPLLLAPNTSLGVAVLSDAARRVAHALGAGFDCSIIEHHHNQKKDAPSGTALRLASACRAGGATLRDDQVISTRGGDVIGEHTVRFAGPGEYLELTHRATSRDLFVRGALRAGHWLAHQSPGLYTIEQALGLA